jgi:membrane protein implicated in regulation of membrane protease activity
MIRLDRNRKRSDVWLGEKMIFFATGAALGIGGMITGLEWLIWLAIAVLVAGFVLRLLDRRGRDHPAPPPRGEEQDSDWARAYQDEDADLSADEPAGEDPDAREETDRDRP